MKIIQLHAENIKRLKAVDITPTEDVVILSGKNEQGKTSVLDSIWLALQYSSAAKNNPNPLRAGTDKGLITLDLGDYIVTRKFNSSGTTSLEIRTPDRSKIASPQKLLDGMIGDLSFDPWDFSRKDSKEQREMLGDIIFKISNGKINLAAFDLKYKELYDQRTEANREKKRLESLQSSLAPPTNQDPQTEVSLTDLTTLLNEAIELEAINKEIADLEHRLFILRTRQSAFKDTEPSFVVKNKIKELEKINQRARQVQEYNKIKNSLLKVSAEIKDINDQLELIEIEKAEALESCALPIDGLKITADGIMVINEDGNEVPFCQASAARRLKISLAIAMAANPKLRVIKITDGSLLDDDNLNIIREMAKDEDFQIWIEYASRNENDQIGVYIEDGRNVSQK